MLKSKILSRNLKKFFCTTDPLKIIDTDVIVVGGGIPGLSLCQALVKSGQFKKENIVLFDRQLKLNDKDYEYSENRIPDLRVITLTPGSLRFFDSIGLLNNIDRRLMKYVQFMQINETYGSSFINLNSQINSNINTFLKYMPDPLANYIRPIENEYICATIEINTLLNGLKKYLNLGNEQESLITTTNELLTKDNTIIENRDNYVYLTLKDKNIRYRAKVLVASDGKNSLIRNKLHIDTKGYPYHETGLVATLRGNRSDNTAYQRFLHNGIFALLPLYDDFYSIVCSMPKNINEDLLKLNDTDFLNFVNKTLQDPSENDFSQLDRLTGTQYNMPPLMTHILSERKAFELSLQYARTYRQGNCVLIGDAAHVVHPMAGQGLNLGIADSAILSDELVYSKQQGRSLNDSRSLDKFNMKSQLNSKTMIFIMDSLKNLYGTNRLVGGIRNYGASLLNQSNIVKSSIMGFAAGDILLPRTYSWENNL